MVINRNPRYFTTFHVKFVQNNFCNNQLAIVNPLKDLFAIKSDEQYLNELSLNNVNYLSL